MISWETVALTTSGNRLRYIVSSQDDAIAGLHDRPRTRNNRHRNVQCTNICISKSPTLSLRMSILLLASVILAPNRSIKRDTSARKRQWRHFAKG